MAVLPPTFRHLWSSLVRVQLCIQDNPSLLPVDLCEEFFCCTISIRSCCVYFIVAMLLKELNQRSCVFRGGDPRVECIWQTCQSFLEKTGDFLNILGLPMAMAPNTILTAVFEVFALLIMGNCCRDPFSLD